MSIRPATHAGSWYTKDPETLSSELDGWLAQVPDAIDTKDVPIPGARLIIAPHAGYSYSGPAAAWAYKCLDLSRAKRIFLLGPNHRWGYHLHGLAVSSCEYYATPLGDLRLDLATIAELHRKSGIEETKEEKLDKNHDVVYDAKGEVEYKKVIHGFTTIPRNHEDTEHSLEMHLPYIYKMMSRVFDNPDDFPPIIPIMVGQTNAPRDRIYGKILAPYLKDPDSVFIVSSDFCHWGRDFHYYYYLPASSAAGDGYELTLAPSGPPIHDSIQRLDRMGMDAIEQGNHRGFVDYLMETENTICGRHPIRVIMFAIEFIRSNVGKEIKNPNIEETWKDDEAGDAEEIEKENKTGKENEANAALSYGKFKFVRYERSALVVRTSQNSVSYASAYAVL